MRWASRHHAESAAATHGRYRPDIQGLRAIAILGVLIYHANEDLLGGGFLGVDIFFVISGYLIAGILVRELARGEKSIAGFYQRRVRRLFPALFVVLAVVLAVGWLLLPPAELRELGRTTLSTTFFVSNVDFLHLTDYFDGAADRRPLLHTWSLAVEEQFYIVFPLLLAALWPLGKGRCRQCSGCCSSARSCCRPGSPFMLRAMHFIWRQRARFSC